MTQLPLQGPVVQVKPQPGIYTLLLIVAILALAATIGIVLYNLLSSLPDGYGLEFGALIDASKLPSEIRPTK